MHCNSSSLPVTEASLVLWVGTDTQNLATELLGFNEYGLQFGSLSA